MNILQKTRIDRIISTEARAGFEPANEGFADLAINRSGTAPTENSRYGTTKNSPDWERVFKVRFW